MKLRSCAKTHVGIVRESNEDAFLCDDALGLYAVADGMGGHAAGEVASQLAVDSLKRNAFQIGLGASVTGFMERVFEKAHAEILADMSEYPGRYGMGTTLTTLVVRKNGAVTAHVGDSRCYRIRDGACVQLTRDHIQARHVLANCLGNRPEWHRFTEVTKYSVLPGDVFVLCSDGLSDCVGCEDIAAMVGALRRDVNDTAHLPVPLADALVQRALDAGGRDNITVVVVEVAA